MTNIEDRLDEEDAEGWKPEPNDKVSGIVEEVTETPGTKWGPYLIYTLRKRDGSRVAIHAFDTVLRNELSDRHVMRGDVLGVKYLGRLPGKDYKSYKVAHDPTPANVAALMGNSPPSPLSPPPAPARTTVPGTNREEPF